MLHKVYLNKVITEKIKGRKDVYQENISLKS